MDSVDPLGATRLLLLTPSLSYRQTARLAVAVEPYKGRVQIAECDDFKSAQDRVTSQPFDVVVLSTDTNDLRWFSRHLKDAEILFLANNSPCDFAEIISAGASDWVSLTTEDEFHARLTLSLRQAIRNVWFQRQMGQTANTLRARDTRIVQLTQRLLSAPFDSRTGWYSHRKILERLDEEIYRNKRYAIPFTAVLVDFEQIEDWEERGEEFDGDAILTRLAERIRGLVRPTDLIGLYGNSSFLIVLASTPNDGADGFRERMFTQLTDPIRINKESFEPIVRFRVLEYNTSSSSTLEEFLTQLENRPTYPATSE